MPGPPDYEELSRFAVELADAAAAVTVRHFRAPMVVQDKRGGNRFDPVTVADREAERVMRELIAGRYPEHGVEGEEWPVHLPQAQWQWQLDPIDGTRSYISGIPLWGTLIALCHQGSPVLACIDHPALGERFTGGRRGAVMHSSRGDRTLRVRSCPSLAESVVFCTDPAVFTPRELRRFRALARGVRLVRYSADCYAYCMLAAGQIDLAVDTGLDFHDIAALVPVVEAAGGTITDWKGGHDFRQGRVVAAGDARVHAQALSLLR